MNTKSKPIRSGTYYVFGSGLMPVPCERVNEIPRLRFEFHAVEARKAMLLAAMRRAP
jgi:hypothetical protein